MLLFFSIYPFYIGCMYLMDFFFLRFFLCRLNIIFWTFFNLLKCFFIDHIMHFLYKFYPYLKKIKDIKERIILTKFILFFINVNYKKVNKWRASFTFFKFYILLLKIKHIYFFKNYFYIILYVNLQMHNACIN